MGPRSLVKTGTNITFYWTQNWREYGKTESRNWLHKMYLISWSYIWTMVHLSCVFECVHVCGWVGHWGGWQVGVFMSILGQTQHVTPETVCINVPSIQVDIPRPLHTGTGSDADILVSRGSLRSRHGELALSTICFILMQICQIQIQLLQVPSWIYKFEIQCICINNMHITLSSSSLLSSSSSLSLSSSSSSSSSSYIDGLVQERCNSSALAMELHLSYTNSSHALWLFAYIYT